MIWASIALLLAQGFPFPGPAFVTSGGGGGAITVIDHNIMSPNAGGPATAAVTLNCTGANFAVIAISIWNGGSENAPTDSSLNPWTLLGTWLSIDASNGDLLGVYYSVNPTVTSSQTFQTTDYIPTLAAACFSNVATSTPLDKTAQAKLDTGSDTAIQPGSITPTANGELIISAFSFAHASSSTTVNSSLTRLNTLNALYATTPGLSLAYYVQPTAAAINPTWTAGTTQTNGIGTVIGSFK